MGRSRINQAFRSSLLRVYRSFDIPPGPRSLVLHRRAWDEEGLPYPEIRMKYLPFALKYPRSFVERVQKMSSRKVYDYCFIGALFRSDTYENRKWIIDFARKRFSVKSYLCITDPPRDYKPLGPYDLSLDKKGVRPIPKDLPPSERAFFDTEYFQIMCQARFTLCPAGDEPWSMRFFESVMCRSVPILERSSHAWRNHLERRIGYRFYRIEDQHEFRSHIVEANYKKFIRHQTLCGPMIHNT